ncbi:MAG: DUF177 domain-containing protein [Actinobacteria bacterium]|nr:DUF177 domain-containing protein [Actinomycetota bacterium]
MAHTPDTLDLRELALKSGGSVERVFSLGIAPVMLGGLSFDVVIKGDGVHVLVRRIGGGYLLDISLRATVYGPCYRCLEEAVLEVQASQEEYVPQRVEEWQEAEVSAFIDDFVVDVAALAREALVLALPLKLLCDESCRGLCPGCGNPTASPECACDVVEPDPRWSPLAGLDLGDAENGETSGPPFDARST